MIIKYTIYNIWQNVTYSIDSYSNPNAESSSFCLVYLFQLLFQQNFIRCIWRSFFSVFHTQKTLTYSADVNDSEVTSRGLLSQFLHYLKFLLCSIIMDSKGQLFGCNGPRFFEFLYQLQSCGSGSSIVTSKDHVKFTVSFCLHSLFFVITFHRKNTLLFNTLWLQN